jgi:hypothetical protein
MSNIHSFSMPYFVIEHSVFDIGYSSLKLIEMGYKANDRDGDRYYKLCFPVENSNNGTNRERAGSVSGLCGFAVPVFSQKGLPDMF